MKTNTIKTLQIAFTVLIISIGYFKTKASGNNTQLIKEEIVIYKAEGVTMKGFIAYDASTNAKRPIVLVVHEWWGQNDYVRNRVKQLAALGYIAMAVDLYGNGTLAETPDDAGKLAGQFYQNPQLAKTRFDAAIAKIKKYSVADTTKIAAIGYCFGGAMVLNIARMGENLKGVVSFHGNLIGVPLDKSKLVANILICHGENDQFVKAEEVATFKKQMDEAKLPYTFKSYKGATHAFSNPDATANGEKFKLPIAYNKEADIASFNEMKIFFTTIFK
jgi:dienelactone hydrolase